MLKRESAVATVAIKDIPRARKFYEEVLGLSAIHSEQDVAFTYQTGNATLLVYQSEYAGTNQATAVTWEVEDRVEAIVNDLKKKGVTFEHYDLPGLKVEGDLHTADGFKAAWFKDPDGNIHALVGS